MNGHGLKETPQRQEGFAKQNCHYRITKILNETPDNITSVLKLFYRLFLLSFQKGKQLKQSTVSIF